MKLAYRDPNYTDYMYKQWVLKLPFGFKFVVMGFKRVEEKPFNLEKADIILERM